jgi:hypothetical protein
MFEVGTGIWLRLEELKNRKKLLRTELQDGFKHYVAQYVTWYAESHNWEEEQKMATYWAQQWSESEWLKKYI